MTAYVMGAILAMAAVTFAGRVAPFLFLGRVSQHRAVRYIGRSTPPVILTLLVLYCLKSVEVWVPPYGLPEGIALAVTIGLHFFWRNALISIACGTAVYMAIVQTGMLAAVGG